MNEIDEKILSLKGMKAKKITTIPLSSLESHVGRDKMLKAIQAIGKLSAMKFAKEILALIPDTKEDVDSFYCPANDSVVVHFLGKFFDVEVYPDGNIDFLMNDDEETLSTYQAHIKIIKEYHAKSDPSRVGIFKQNSPSSNLKN